MAFPVYDNSANMLHRYKQIHVNYFTGAKFKFRGTHSTPANIYGATKANRTPLPDQLPPPLRPDAFTNAAPWRSPHSTNIAPLSFASLT